MLLSVWRSLSKDPFKMSPFLPSSGCDLVVDFTDLVCRRFEFRSYSFFVGLDLDSGLGCCVPFL